LGGGFVKFLKKKWKKIVLAIILPIIIGHLMPPYPFSALWFVGIPTSIVWLFGGINITLDKITISEIVNILKDVFLNPYVIITTTLFYFLHSFLIFLFLEPLMIWILKITKSTKRRYIKKTRIHIFDAMIWLET